MRRKFISKTKFEYWLQQTLLKFRNPFAVIGFIVLSIYAFSLLYMLLWGLITSLKMRGDFVQNLFGLPTKWEWKNYVVSFQNLYVPVANGRVYLMQLFINSFIFAFGQSFISTMSTAACAYVSNKYKCKVSSLMYSTVIFMMVFPVVTSLGASIAFHRSLGLYDNLLGILYTCIGFNTGNFLISYAIFSGLSWAYAESAMIDGAGHWKIFLKIMLPLARVPILVLLVLSFVGNWNNWMTPLIYLPSFPTAAVALYQFQWMTDTAISSTPIQMAAAMLICLPCVIIYWLMRNHIVGNLTMGGLKG